MQTRLNGKRLVILVVMVGCLGGQSFAQKRPPEPSYGNVGPIRSIEEWDDKTVITGLDGSRRTRRVLDSRELFDRRGNQIVYTVYQDDGPVLFGDKNTYDANDRLVEKQTIHAPLVYLPDKQIYIYDDRGRLIETKGFDSRGKHLGGYLHTYDDADNMVGEMSYQNGSNLVYNHHHTRYVYDSDGYVIGEHQYVANAGESTPDEFGMGYQKEVFLNDKEGRHVLTGYFKADNTLVKIQTNEYDANGNALQEIERKADGQLLRKVSYSYVFDRRGNWVKQVRREWTAEGVGSVFRPLEVSYRTIRYYAQPYETKQ